LALARLDRAGTVFQRLGLGYYLNGVIELKLELQGVSSSDGSDAATIAAPDPGETLPSGGAEGD
jgi:hypothetical protein